MRLASPARKGLSLIEVLVSLAIFLFAFIAIARLIDLSSDEALEIEWQTTGLRLAQSKLAEVSAGVIPLQSQSQVSFDEEPNYSWTLEIENAEVTNLYNVSVVVSRTQQGVVPFEVTLSQMVFDPNFRGGPATPTDNSVIEP